MKWISHFTERNLALGLILAIGWCSGCRLADSNSFTLNPVSILKDGRSKELSSEEIERNSKEFVEQVKAEAETPPANAYVIHNQHGQNEIMAWYRDKDPAHISSARKHFEKSLADQKMGNPEAHHGLAVVADLEKNFSEAEKHYQLALSQDPSNSKILGNLGYSYLLQNRLQESERFLLQATQKDPTNQDAIKHLGDVYARRGETELAENTYRRVMSAENARQMLAAETARPPEEQGTSLVGRLRSRQNGDEPTAITRDIERLRQVRNDQELRLGKERESQQPQNPNQQSQARMEYASYQEELKRRLAAIDSEAVQNYHGQAVHIDPQTGAVARAATEPRGTETEYQQPSSRMVQAQDYSSPLQNPAAHNVTPGLDNNFQQRAGMVVNHQYETARPEVLPANATIHTPAATEQGVDPYLYGRTPTIATPNNYGPMTPEQRRRFAATRRQDAELDYPLQLESGRQETRSARAVSTPSPNRTPIDLTDEPWTGVKPEQLQSLNSNVANQSGQAMQNQFRRSGTGTPQPSVYGQQHAQQTSSLRHPPDMLLADPGNRLNQQQGPLHGSIQNLAGENSMDHSPPREALATNDFEEARLTAARMGMGMSLATPSSSMNQTVPRQLPGANSFTTSQGFPQPDRMLPTDVTPLDLSQARNLSGQQTHRVNGGTLPPQFGTASRFQEGVSAAANQSAANLKQQQLNMQADYDRAQTQLANRRNQATQQLNRVNREFDETRPLNVHSQSSQMQPVRPDGIRRPINDSFSNPQTSTPSQAQYVQPEAYPYGPGRNRSTSQNISGDSQSQIQLLSNEQNENSREQYSSPQYQSHPTPSGRVVTPESYQYRQEPSGRAEPSPQSRPYSAHNPTQQPMQHSSDYHSGGGSTNQLHSNNGMPLIVPGTR